MNYSRIYSNIISRRVKTPLKACNSVYTELHHILPKCIGGTDNKDNLVRLTAREHFIAHRLLTKIYPNNKPLIYAVFMMSRTKQNGGYICSKEYERLKIIISKEVSKRFKGKSLCEQQLRKMSRSSLKLWKSDEHKEKIIKMSSNHYLAIAPSGERFGFNYSLTKFCEEHFISEKMLRSSIENKGTICDVSSFTKSEKSKNTVGWACCITKAGNQFKPSEGCIVREPCLVHMERTNKNRSKNYIITDPENKVIYLEYGGLEFFCKREGLSFNMMWNSLKSNGVKCIQGRNKTKKTLKTIGWSCKQAWSQ